MNTTYFGDIVVTTQKQVNDLKTKLDGISVIVGNVTIGYVNPFDRGTDDVHSDITDISSMNSIIGIVGRLKIARNKADKFDGLKNLQFLSGNFHMFFNDNLLSIENFVRLKHIGGSFIIGDNKKISTIKFPVLESINGYFSIGNNHKLTSVEFNEVKMVKGDFMFNDINTLNKVSMDNIKEMALASKGRGTNL